MKPSRNLFLATLATLALSATAGCDSSDTTCFDDSCGANDERTDSTSPSPTRNFEIEIVGEGAVVVNDETCTTQHGICRLTLGAGAPVVLDGPFSYQAERGRSSIRGYCPASAQCELELFDDVRLVAVPEQAEQARNERPQIGGRYQSAGRLPGEPDFIIDIFPRPIGDLDALALESAPLVKGGPNE